MIISDKEKCPCCSGKLFENCCKAYSGSSHKDFKIALDKYEYIKAYNIEIARLADYLAKVNAHTIPLLNDKNPLGSALLDIDVKAVEEFLENIFFVLSKKKIEDNLEKRFWTIGQLIQNDKWKDLFQFYTILYCDFFAKKNLKQYLDDVIVNEKTSKKLLQIISSHLDYRYGIGKKLEVANLIMKRTDSIFEQLQYKFAISMEYYVANDVISSKRYADEVVEQFREYAIQELEIFQLNKIAEVYELYAGLFEQDEYYKYALELYEKCEETGLLNNAGYAKLYNAMAYIYFKQQIIEKSIEYYKKSYVYEKNNFSLIHMAESYLYIDEFGKAEECLNTIEVSSLEIDIVDYYIVKSELFICTNQREGVKSLINEMQNLNLSLIPFYNDIFNKLIMEMQKNIEVGNSFLEKVKKLHKYLILQPNFYGVGLNINKIFEDL